MSTEQSENGPDASLETGATGSTTSKFDALRWRLLWWWGFLFRALFICAVGVIGWFWFDPPSIDDVPLCQLTPIQIVRNIFAFLVVIFCVQWFLRFPLPEEGEEPRENRYVIWGQVGNGVVITVLVLAIYYWFMKSSW